MLKQLAYAFLGLLICILLGLLIMINLDTYLIRYEVENISSQIGRLSNQEGDYLTRRERLSARDVAMILAIKPDGANLYGTRLAGLDLTNLNFIEFRQTTNDSAKPSSSTNLKN